MKAQPNDYKPSTETSDETAPTTQKTPEKREKQNDQQIQTRPPEHDHQHFIERAISIPLVRESYDKAHLLAEMMFLGRFGMKAANTTVSTLTSYASQNEPIQHYYHHYIQPHVEKADSMGCRSLDYIQTKVPLINEPSSKIIHVVVKEPSSKIIGGVRARLDNTMKTVSHPVEILARTANKKMTVIVDNIEELVDSYFPPLTMAKNNRSAKTAANRHENGVRARQKSQEPQQPTDEIPKSTTPNGAVAEHNQIRRLYQLMKHVPSRVSHQVKRSTDELLHFFEEHSSSSDAAVKGNNDGKQKHLQLKNIADISIGTLRYIVNTSQKHLPHRMNTPIAYTSSLATGLFGSVKGFAQNMKTSASTRSAEAAEVPNWLKNRVNSTLQITSKQLKDLQQEFARRDTNYTEKFAILLNNIKSQVKTDIDHGKEKGQAYLTRAHD